MTATPQPDPNSTQPPPRAIRWRTVFWIGFLICAITAGWLKASQNRRARQQYEQAQAERARRAEELDSLGIETAGRIHKWWHDGFSRHELEIELNAGEPFNLLPCRNGQQMTTWTDPASGGEFEFYFRGDKWATVASSRAGDANLPHLNRPRAIYQDRREMVREMIVGFVPFVWLFLFAAMAALTLLMAAPRSIKRERRVVSLRLPCQILADAMLATAILCSLAWLVAPNYSVTFDGVTSNDGLALGTVMLVISIPFVAGISPRKPLDRSPVGRARLQYSLRTLLILMTLCAVVFALAPLGYVVALYAGGGGGLYWLARRLQTDMMPE